MSEQTTPSTKPRRRSLFGPPPFWMIAGLLILVVGSWLPLVLIARARVSTSSRPKIHIFQDMDNQPNLRAQQASAVFADGRAMRGVIPGTVARGQLQEDDHYYRGFTQTQNPQTGKWEVAFHEGFPQQVQLTPALLQRGQERFNVFCAGCHGRDGFGNGPVNARAVELQEPKWVPAASLHSDTVRERPEGHLYNTINNGIRNMPPHGAQIPVPDRWAIVAYVRALQLSQNAPASLLSPERIQTLQRQ